MNHAEKSLSIALYTCSQWHSDHGSGLSLLSLGSTRKLHSEDHRLSCVTDIDHDIEYVKTSMPFEEDESTGRCVEELRQDEVDRLEALQLYVRLMPIGVEWLSYEDYFRFSEILYRNNEL